MRENSFQKNIFFLFRLTLAMTVTISFYQCTPKVPAAVSDSHTAVNPAHLDSLYEEKNVLGKKVGIVHIYSEYPDYHWVGDQDEGIACVDDASRAAVFYLRQYQKTSSDGDLHKATMLLKFLLQMQSPNGYFYNFIWTDGSINTAGSTSQNIPTWWSWRSLWAIGEGIKILKPKDSFVKELIQHRTLLLNAMLKDESMFSEKTDTAAGLIIPAWLPRGAATDQASIIIMGLSLAYQQNVFSENRAKRDSVVLLMNHLADGIIMMQIEEPNNFYDGAFLSWNNLWHAYANLQSYALLTTGQVLHDPHMEAHALYEINTFYPSLFERGYLQSFWVRVSKGKISVYDMKNEPQIAYGIRPMVFACMKAYEVTGDNKYKTRAQQLATWFSGQNPAHAPMYDPATGRGYDGISNTNQINRNSGAESTIEALLTMQAIEEVEKK